MVERAAARARSEPSNPVAAKARGLAQSAGSGWCRLGPQRAAGQRRRCFGIHNRNFRQGCGDDGNARQVGKADAGTDAAAETTGGAVVMVLLLRHLMLMVSLARHRMLMLMRAGFGGKGGRHGEREGRAGKASVARIRKRRRAKTRMPSLVARSTPFGNGTEISAEPSRVVTDSFSCGVARPPSPSAASAPAARRIAGNGNGRPGNTVISVAPRNSGA